MSEIRFVFLFFYSGEDIIWGMYVEEESLCFPFFFPSYLGGQEGQEGLEGEARRLGRGRERERNLICE